MNIKIIGCGWLGIQLGIHLSKQGVSVSGSYRSKIQKEVIAKTSIKGFELDIDVNSQISINTFENGDVFIISLPPIRKEEPRYYARLLANLVQQFPISARVIFTSSIGIYPQKEGVFTEDYLFQEEEKSVLFNAEVELKKVLGERLTILRLGGLIGPKRHPIKSLRGRSISNDGLAPVNLIHSVDICRVIDSVLSRNTFGMTYNLVFPIDMHKKSYYSLIAEKYNFEPPQYGIVESLNRSVDGRLVCADLNFDYLVNPQDYSEELD